MSAPRMYQGRALTRSASMLAAAFALALVLAAGVFLACALPYVLNLPR